MATKDFKIRHSLTVSENATIEGNLTLGGNTVSRLIDSDEVVSIINQNVSQVGSDSDSIIGVFQDPDNGTPQIYATVVGPVQFRSKNDSGSTLFPGTAVYIKGISGEIPTVDKANASSGSTMPAFGIVSAESSNNSDCFVTTFGDLKGLDTSVFTVGQTVFISADSDGALTQTKPSNTTDLIQNIGIVTRVHGSSGSIRVGGSGRTNDIDNDTRAKLDSDSAAIAQLRRDVDSDSLIIQLLDGRVTTLENTPSESVDSDVAAIAQLRRDADSDSIRIQEIATSLEQINELVDSDLKAIADLRNDVDSDSLAIQSLSTRVDSIDSDFVLQRQLKSHAIGGSYRFDTSTTAGDPGSGDIRFSIDWTTGVEGSSYNAYVSETDKYGLGLSPLLDQLTTSTNSKKALVVLFKADDPSRNAKFYVTGQTDNGSYRTLDIIYVDRDAWGQVSNGDEIFMSISIIGDAGSSNIDSDLKAIADLRNDVDSDSAKLQALEITVAGLPTTSFDSEKAASVINHGLELGEFYLGLDPGVDEYNNPTNLWTHVGGVNGIYKAGNGLNRTNSTGYGVSSILSIDSDTIKGIIHQNTVAFNITNNGTSAYTFSGNGFTSGTDNPTIYLQRGHTYAFNMNASGHPFQIRYTSGGSAYSDGVNNNGAETGLILWTVPMNAPDQLVYQCTAHSGMVGTIKIGKQGFDSDQIASMILENSSGSGSGMTDSDLAVVAKLRADVDSDSIKLQALEETVAGLSVGAGFDSDQVVAIINENPTSSGTGMTDSDLKVVADLRNDITALQTGGVVSQESTFTTFKYKATQGQSTFSGLDRDNQTLAYTVGNINVYINGILLNDSDDYTATNGTSVVLDLAADSDDVVVIQKMRSAFDSDTILNIWNNNQSNLTISRYDYTATQSQTVFSGADNNGNSLSYIKDKIQVFLNGILLINTNDYTATNGTSLTLTVAADSDDTLSIIKYLGADAQASDNLTVTRFTYRYGEDGNSVVGDSEITGGDENGNTLSYVAGKIQVYSNGILLEDSDDYVATDGSTITLRAAPDSDDVVSIFKYLGSETLGFDSEQVVSILNENKIIDYKTYSYDGTLSLNTGTKRLYISIACTLSTVDAYLATASVGADVILNIKKNGSSLNTLTITDGNSISENNSFNVSFVKGDYITVDITQIGSSTAGEDLYANFNFV